MWSQFFAVQPWTMLPKRFRQGYLDLDLSTEQSLRRKTKHERMRDMLNSVFVGGFVAEIIFFLYKTGYSMLEPSIKLYIYQTQCYEHVRNASNVCENLGDHPHVENYVQKVAAEYITIYKVLLNVPAIFLGLFCGSWSDRIGRKIPIMLPCFGTILTVIIYMVSLVNPDIPASPFILIGATVNGLFGKSAVITMAVHSYASDVSDEENRTQKISRLVSMNFFGQFLGSLIVGFMLDTVGFEVIFSTVAGINFAAVVITMFFLKETVAMNIEDAEERSAKKLLHPSHLRDSLQVLVRPREYNGRIYLVSLVCIVVANQACKTGEIDVSLLFVQHWPLHWAKSTYGYLLAYNNAVIGLCLFLILPALSRKLNINDMLIVIMAVAFKILRLLFNAFSYRTWMVFMAATMDFVAGMIVSGLKSLISKLVSADEFGKCFSLISSGETASNLIGSIVFNGIYSLTVDIHPGMAYVAEAGFYVLLLIILIVLHRDMNRTAHYRSLETGGAQPAPPGADDALMGEQMGNAIASEPHARSARSDESDDPYSSRDADSDYDSKATSAANNRWQQSTDARQQRDYAY